MIVEEKPKQRPWPRMGVSPDGKRARFDCMGDLPKGWELEEPLEGEEPKRGPGRPRKAA